MSSTTNDAEQDSKSGGPQGCVDPRHHRSSATCVASSLCHASQLRSTQRGHAGFRTASGPGWREFRLRPASDWGRFLSTDPPEGMEDDKTDSLNEADSVAACLWQSVVRAAPEHSAVGTSSSTFRGTQLTSLRAVDMLCDNPGFSA
jgi:hypothetical protein